MHIRSVALSLCLCAMAAVAAAGSGAKSTRASNSNMNGAQQEAVERGRKAIVVYGCGKCHRIPRIQGASGVFGPPLNFLARRTYIAGTFPNTPDNLARWVKSPQTMKPGTDMPALGLSDAQARDIAAYLDTLQ